MESNTIALWSLLLIVIGSLLTYSAYLYAMSKLQLTQVSIYAYVNPIVVIFLRWLI
jgi:drug/metabolite transporter (DMT)-like permease